MVQDLMICSTCGQLVDRTHHKCPVQIKAKMERDRKQYQNEKSTAKELTSSRWKKFRKTIILMDGGECQRCLIKLHKHTYTNLTIQHIQPRALHPELMYDVNNCVTLCQTCNNYLGLRGLDFEWSPENRKNLFDDYVI